MKAFENCECSDHSLKSSFFVSILGLDKIVYWGELLVDA